MLVGVVDPSRHKGLVFRYPRNEQLLRAACAVPSLLVTGYTSFKQFCVTTSLLCVGYMVVVMVVLKDWSTAKNYFSVWLEHGQDKDSHTALLSASFRGMATLSLLGVVSMLLNILSPSEHIWLRCTIACLALMP